MIPRGPDPIAKGIKRTRTTPTKRDKAMKVFKPSGPQTLASPKMEELATPVRPAAPEPGNGAWWWF